MSKSNAVLGEEVKQHLISKGVETPVIENILDSEQQKAVIRNNFRQIMDALGLDRSDDSLSETPDRIAKMYVDELYWGLDYSNFPKCTAIENKFEYDEMVLEKNITVLSTCEHHFVTIDGLASVAYIPDKKVIGLSKLNRIVEFFSKRPQVQERLTEQIFHTLCYILETEDVAVTIDAVHFCVRSRGVRDYNSSTLTSKLGGRFKSEPSLRNEYLKLRK